MITLTWVQSFVHTTLATTASRYLKTLSALFIAASSCAVCISMSNAYILTPKLIKNVTTYKRKYDGHDILARFPNLNTVLTSHFDQ